MRHQPNPWKWPLCITLALVVFSSAFMLTPASWIKALLSLRELTTPLEKPRHVWMEIQDIEPLTQVIWEPPPDRPEPDKDLPEPDLPADWWQQAWRVHLAEDRAGLMQQASQDTTPAFVLDLIATNYNLLSVTTPDSALAARLALLEAADQLHVGLARMKEMLPGILYSRKLRDLNSRAAHMFDEGILSEIIVTDPD